MYKDEIDWCLRKLEEALNDYDLESAKNYRYLALVWLRK